MPTILKRNATANGESAKAVTRQRTRRTAEEHADIDKRREALFERMQMDEEDESAIVTERFCGLSVEEDDDELEGSTTESAGVCEVSESVVDTGEISVEPENLEIKEEESVVSEQDICVPSENTQDVQVESDESLLDKIKRTTVDFYKDDGSNSVESLHLSCVEGAREVVRDKGYLIFPTYKVYVNGFEKAWNAINEVRVAKGEKFEIDTGVSMVMPSHTLLVLKGSPDIEEKYGVRIDGDVVIRRQDAMYRITVPMIAIADLAYVSNYTGILHAYFVSTEEV